MSGFVQTDSVIAGEQVLRPDRLALASADAGVEEWAAQIRNCFAQRSVHTLELAKVIHSARSALPRGQWAELWRAGRLPFSKRKAQMLAAVGKVLRDLNAQTFAHLPSGWSILYWLAQLPGPVLVALIADGSVHPALTLAQAKALVARFRGDAGTKSSESSKVRRRLRQFEEFVRATNRDWTAGDRRLVRAGLERLIVTLSEPVPLSVLSQPSATLRLKVHS